MDFASLMTAQISKSKLPSTTNDAKRYVKRADLEAQRLVEYENEKRRQEEERKARADHKRKLEGEEADRAKEREEKRRRLAEESRRQREDEEREIERARRKRLGLPDLLHEANQVAIDGAGISANEDIEDEELKLKLRELDEPAVLFGENHIDRLRRYQRITSRALAPVMTKGPIPTTLETVPEAEMKVPDALPKDPDQLRFLHRQLASYFTMVLTEWQLAMVRRSDDVKQSSSGKAAYNSMVQARDHLVPLFRKLEKGDMEKSILEPVVEIIRCCQNRRYVDANDAYLRLSIGKAAWPIGVTMVGIHERSAREKLHQNDRDAAHIMSDETTRKFLQSIKRCLSFAQTRWPPDDHLQLMG